MNSQKKLFEARNRAAAWPLSILSILAVLLASPLFAQQTSERPFEPSTSLSGYMELHYNKPFFGADVPAPIEDGQIDFHRFVLLVTHQFTERIRFVGELELEHAFVEGLEEAGELELEQAYLDFLMSRSFNVRAGMLLVPIGIINERHEPPVFYGVERPFVDTVIVPTTWFDAGAGVYGEVGHGWRYRVYVMPTLNAAEFSAEEGIREGRQKGGQANARRLATTGRVEYVAIRGLTAGASFWTGESGFAFQPRFDVPVRLFEADARYSRDRLELRAQFAQAGIENAGDINDAVFRQSGVNPNIARSLRGGYLEAGYRVLAARRYGEVGAFVRYENFDTQFRMPDGYTPLPAFDREAWVVGANYWPEPDIAVKFDYTIQRNQSSVVKAPNSLNIGLGWWF